jgi:hypothetical protein
LKLRGNFDALYTIAKGLKSSYLLVWQREGKLNCTLEILVLMFFSGKERGGMWVPELYLQNSMVRDYIVLIITILSEKE